MKYGKIILSGAAIIVTAASAFAFKAHHKFGGVAVYGHTVAGGSCKISNCFTTTSNVKGTCTTANHNALLDHFRASNCTGAASHWSVNG